MTQSKARSKLWAGINGATGAQVLTVGGTLGTANIAFAAQPTATDTLTINGTVFTFVAAEVLAADIEIKGSLALTLAEAETRIEGHADAGVVNRILANVDVTDTDTDLTFRFYPGQTGSAVSSTDGANTTDTAFSAGDAAPYIDINKTTVYTEWADASTTLGIIELPNGTIDGQMIELYCVSEATAGDTIEIYGNFTGDKNRVTVVGAAADGATFYWDKANTVWKLTKATNVAIHATLLKGLAL